MNKSSPPTILVIIGITGDLSKRYLLPAIQKLAEAGELPSKFQILGVTRQRVDATEFLKSIGQATDFLITNLQMCTGINLAHQEDYHVLTEHLVSIEQELGAKAQRLFYLSIPPHVSQPVVELLGTTGLSDIPNTKLLLEKPFGTDLVSAKELIEHTQRHFTEEQVYRIDHYLAKEMAQNMVVFREANPLFKRTWHGDFIESIEIMAAESIDIEGRVNFYEQTGALRDVMQSHILQLAALTLMDEATTAHRDISTRRLEALRQLHLRTDQPVETQVIRGQYEGYRQEVDNPKSNIETFISVDVVSDDPRWAGVPIRLLTGKALQTKQTQICITYKCDEGSEPNQLILHIQPNEGTELQLWAKAPGYEHKIQQQTLRFAYQDHFVKLPDAYEQVILDAIHSNHSLFASSDEIIESWRILEPVLHAWGMSTRDLVTYSKGSTSDDILSAAKATTSITSTA